MRVWCLVLGFCLWVDISGGRVLVMGSVVAQPRGRPAVRLLPRAATFPTSPVRSRPRHWLIARNTPRTRAG